MLRQLQMLRTSRVRFGSGIHRLTGSKGQHDHYAALGVRVSQRLLRPVLVPELEGVALTGQPVMFSSSVLAVMQRQKLSTATSQSLHRLSYLISEGYQDLGSRGCDTGL